MSDSEEWFEILDTEIIIDPYSNIDLEFTAISPDSESTQLSFNIIPRYHTYDSKSYNFYIQPDVANQHQTYLTYYSLLLP